MSSFKRVYQRFVHIFQNFLQFSLNYQDGYFSEYPYLVTPVFSRHFKKGCFYESLSFVLLRKRCSCKWFHIVRKSPLLLNPWKALLRSIIFSNVTGYNSQILSLLADTQAVSHICTRLFKACNFTKI